MAGQVLALGSFDGIHLGHRRILDRARSLASQSDSPVGVLTCYPLPAQFIHPDFTYVLTPLAEKTRLLVELGVDFIHTCRFDEKTRNTEPDEFVLEQILPLKPSAVVAGHDHRFGRSGRGDIALLRRLLGPRKIEVSEVPEYQLLGAPVRSTRIREHLLLGHVRLAGELLGRPYRLDGPVVPGTQTGRRLGFPTINLVIEEQEKLVPADGVYAVVVDIEYPGSTQRNLGVLNIGHRPTFRGESRTIEAHLFDVELDSTPVSAAALLMERLRPERRFSTPEDLARQIRADVDTARTLLSERRQEPAAGNP
jgi:riboflavin kinase/FMN adenylyltransferase